MTALAAGCSARLRKETDLRIFEAASMRFVATTLCSCLLLPNALA